MKAVTLVFWLRRSLRALVAWSLAVGFMVAAVSWAFLSEAATPADAARFAASLEALAISVRPLFGEAIRLDTAAGFLHWRILGLLPLILGAYFIVFATRMTVREERRGATDLVLSTPLGRGRFAVERLVALITLCLVIALGGLLGGGLVARLLGADYGWAGLLFAGLNLGLLLAVWAMLAALVSQLTLSRAVAGAISSLLMVAIHVGSNVAASQEGLESFARWLPTGAYSSSMPLLAEVGVRGTGLVTLGLQAMLLALATLVLFARRDLNVAHRFDPSSWRRKASAGPGYPAPVSGARSLSSRPRLSSALLRGPVSRDAWALKGVGLAWAAGLSSLVAFLVSIEPTLREPMEQFLDDMGPMAQVFAADFLVPGALVAVMFGMFLAPSLAVFAVLQAGRWAGELQDGLMALDLSTRLGRARLLVSRVVAVLLVGGAALALTWLVALAAAAAADVPVPAGKLATAALGALPVALVYLGVGLAVAAWWRPAWAAPFAGALALLDFVYGIVASTLQLPEWARGLSVFSRYGNPAIEGLSLSDHGALLAAGSLLVVLALAGFRKLDLTW